MNEQHTKDMHYVAAFYLRQFYDLNGYLHTLTKKHLNIKKTKAENIFYERYFYSLEKGALDQFGQQLECEFSKFETTAKNVIGKFIFDIKNNYQVSENEKVRMSEIAAIFYVRTRSFREDNLDTTTRLIDFMQDAINNSESDRIFFGEKDDIGMSKKELEVENRKLSEENSKHIKAMLKRIPMYTNVFFDKNWKVYIATGRERFITSDNPVMDVSTGSDRILDNNIILRKQYFIVSPEILITTEPREMQSKRIKRKRITGDDVNRFNAKITDQANIRIVSSSTDFLELAKEISKEANSLSFLSSTQNNKQKD